MTYSEGRGIKTSQWFPNEIFREADINHVGLSQYLNFTDTLATMAKGLLSEGKDVVVGGLELEHDNLLTCTLRSGAAVSSQGYYLSSDVWGFSASAGDIFSVLLSEDTQVAFNSGGSQDRIDLVEIRPIEVPYEAKSRNFKDPVTKLITTSVVNTRKEYGYEIAVREGTEAASPVAPSRTSGWIKLAEVYVASGVSSISQDKITDVRSGNDWTVDVESTVEHTTEFSRSILDDRTAQEALTTLGIYRRTDFRVSAMKLTPITFTGITARDVAHWRGSLLWVLDATNNELNLFELVSDDPLTSTDYFFTAASFTVATYDRLERVTQDSVIVLNTTANEIQVYQLVTATITLQDSVSATLIEPKISCALNEQDVFITDIASGLGSLSLYRWNGSSLSEIASVSNTSTNSTPVAALSPTRVATINTDNETLHMWEVNGSSFDELGSIAINEPVAVSIGVPVIGRFSDTDVWLMMDGGVGKEFLQHYRFDFDSNTWECLANNLPAFQPITEAHVFGNGHSYIGRRGIVTIESAPVEAGIRPV